MTNRKYILKNPNGGIAIMEVVEGADVNDCVEKFSQSQFTPTEVVELTDSIAVPGRDEYRNSWEFDGTTIKHDIDKARQIKQDIIRRERAPLLAALDIEISRKLARGEDASAEEAKRQKLRDATQHKSVIEAKSVEELKAAKPLNDV